MIDTLVHWLFWVASNDSPELKDALVAIASVAVVVWTGALVIRQIAQSNSTWKLVGAMDLIQSAFVTAILGIGLPSFAFRGVALLFMSIYAISYYSTLRTFQESFRKKQTLSYQAAFDAMDSGRPLYFWSIFLFYAGAITIVALPSRGTVFAITFTWFFIGFQVTLSALHSARFKS